MAAVATVAGISAGVTACSGSENGAGNQVRFVQVKPGYSEVSVADRKAAPTLEGQTLTGEKFALSSLTGKVAVVNFWGSWCGPCRAEAAALETVAKSTASQGVQFVGVDERDTRTNARSFVKAHDVSYPSVFDEDGALAAQWPAASGPPYTFIIDRKGRVAARFLGGVTVPELTAAINKVTAER